MRKLLALVLSIVLVYMVMASQFESLLHPFTILLTIPLALVGAVLMFLVTGITVNIMGIIGMVMLAGIAVNNSIILVDRIGQLKDAGLSLTDAIAEAGQQRIRPILMTSLTTILALVPMALGIGEGASLSSPMAIAVIGGLLTSTLLSLVVIPCVYYVFESAKTVVQLVHIFQHFCLVLCIHYFMADQYLDHAVNGIIQHYLYKLLLSRGLQSAEIHYCTELVIVYFLMETADFTFLHKLIKLFRFHPGRICVTHLIL